MSQNLITDLFTDHPASVGETYGQHMGQATSFGARMIFAGFACLLHGFLPFLFVSTGRQTIELLHDRMVVNRSRHSRASRGETPLIQAR
jgi:hypothetical protein